MKLINSKKLDFNFNFDFDIEKIKEKIKSLIKKEVLVIDIGSETIKIIDVKIETNQITIRKALMIEDANKYFKNNELINSFGLVEKIFEVVKGQGIETKNVILTGYYGRVQSKLLTLPMIDKNDIKIFINSEVGKHFPSYSKIEDELNYMMLGKVESEDSKNIMGVIATIPSKEAIKIVEEMKKMKFNVEVLDVKIHAISNLFRLDKAVKGESRDGLAFKIGNHSSEVYFSNKNIIIFERTINFGIKGFVKAIQDEFEITPREAENLLKDNGAIALTETINVRNKPIPAERYNQIIEEVYGNALGELIRSYQYVVSNYELEFNEISIISSGGELANIALLTKQILDIETFIWEMNADEEIKLNDELILVNNTGKNLTSDFSLAVGTALRGVE